jgi:hypothetical protein
MSRLGDLNEDILCDIFQRYVQLEGPRNICRWTRILHISRAWRTAALNQPSLFTSIDVRMPSQVAFMLAHSKDLPLNVDISHESSLAACPLIEPHGHRLHALDVHGPLPGDIGYPGPMLSWVLTPARFPNLSAFTFDVEGQPYMQRLLAVLQHMPVLEELNVRMEGILTTQDRARAEMMGPQAVELARLARLTLCATDAIFHVLWRALSVPAHAQYELTVIIPMDMQFASAGYHARLFRAHVMRANSLSPIDAADIVVEYKAHVLSRLGHVGDKHAWRTMFETRLSSSGEHSPRFVYRCVYADDWRALPLDEMMGLNEILPHLQLQTVSLRYTDLLAGASWQHMFGSQPAVRRVTASAEICRGLLSALDPRSPAYAGLFPALDTLVVLGGAGGAGAGDATIDIPIADLSMVLGYRPLRRLVLEDCGEAAEDMAACLRAAACAASVEVRRSAAHGAADDEK